MHVDETLLFIKPILTGSEYILEAGAHPHKTFTADECIQTPLPERKKERKTEQFTDLFKMWKHSHVVHLY